MLPINKYARDEEYEFPEYKEIAEAMLKIFKETTKADLKVVEGHKHYVNGMGFSRYWEYPWAITNSKVSKEMKVLDVGCGRAPFLPYLGSVIGCESHGIDYGGYGCIEDGLWGCDEGRNEKYNFTVKKADARERIPYLDNSFNRIFCISTLEHMNDGKEVIRAVKEMVRVLKPNGLLVITIDEGLYHREIEEAAGLPYYGDCDFSRPKHKKPYAVLGMIFIKPGKEEEHIITTGTVYGDQMPLKEEEKLDVPPEMPKSPEKETTSKHIKKEKEGITFKEIGEKIKAKFKRKK